MELSSKLCHIEKPHCQKDTCCLIVTLSNILGHHLTIRFAIRLNIFSQTGDGNPEYFMPDHSAELTMALTTITWCKKLGTDYQ
jgi:hypothetical protein